MKTSLKIKTRKVLDFNRWYFLSRTRILIIVVSLFLMIKMSWQCKLLYYQAWLERVISLCTPCYSNLHLNTLFMDLGWFDWTTYIFFIVCFDLRIFYLLTKSSKSHASAQNSRSWHTVRKIWCQLVSEGRVWSQVYKLKNWHQVN